MTHQIKKHIVQIVLIGLGVVFLLIPGLEPLGALTLLGGVATLAGKKHGK